MKNDFAAFVLSAAVAAGLPPAARAADADYAPPQGTVLYYPFDSASTALASFGAEKAPLRQGTGSVAFAADGRFGGCLYFDGGATLELPELPASMPLGKSPYTVSAWVRADKGLARSGGWIGYGLRDASGGGNSFRQNGPDGVQNYWNYRDINVDTPGLADGRWHHVAGTWDGAERRVYFDGRLAGSDRQTPDVRRGPLLVGATLNDRPYTGWIDDVLVAARAFGADEVARLYAKGVPCLRAFTVAALAADDGKLLAGGRFVTREQLRAEISRTLDVTGRWLLLPVKNGGKMRKARVLAGGKTLHAFDIEFAAADETPDWNAVLDVSALKGRKVTVEVDGLADGARALARLACTDDAPAPDGYDGKFRPQFHFSARRGWLNDPNGLSFYNGEWHLFFQHNPYGAGWGNMHWGHAVSKDLFHWRELGEALYPDELGAMFSGSAVVDREGTAGFGKGAHVLLFTGTADGAAQSLAYSTDGRKYTKYAGNPVVPKITDGNRDPRVFWYAPGRHWVLVLYVAEKGRHNVAIFNSPDLKKWTRVGTIPGDPVNVIGYLYECPELFELPVEGENVRRWVVFGATGEYAVGTFDGKTFTPEEEHIAMYRNFGGYYAAQTFGDVPDGRRILLPWCHEARMPGMPFNQCLGLPRTLGLRRTPAGLRLVQFPVKEVETLRDGPARPFAEFSGELVDATVDIRPRPSARIVFSLRGIRVAYDAARETLEIPGGTTAWPLEKGRFRARFFIDRTGMETFALDGSVCLPSRDAVADGANLKLQVVEGADKILDDRSRAYRLKSIWAGAR